MSQSVLKKLDSGRDGVLLKKTDSYYGCIERTGLRLGQGATEKEAWRRKRRVGELRDEKRLT
jgi:hypothetical protein